MVQDILKDDIPSQGSLHFPGDKTYRRLAEAIKSRIFLQGMVFFLWVK
jgi:hypothetical protein